MSAIDVEAKVGAGAPRSPQTLFDVIRCVTRRVEPFHSVALAWFLDDDRSFARDFLRAFVPAAFLDATALLDDVDGLVVRREDVLATGDRVDVTIAGPGGLVAVEVKTTDASATKGQLTRYRRQLAARDQATGVSRPIHVLYLTPFTAGAAGDVADRLATVREFERFSAEHPGEGTHVSWSDVVALYPRAWQDCVGAAMRDHLSHVSRDICDRGRLRQLARARGLDAFVGADAVKAFFDRIDAAGVVFDDPAGGDLVFPLDQAPANVEVLCDALLALVDV